MLTKFLGVSFCLFLIACGQMQQVSSKASSTTLSGFSAMKKTAQEWKETLSPEQYYILREKGTERPFSGALLLNHDKGIYRCSACGNPLFNSEAKFDSHCGWPSFDREIQAGNIITKTDNSHGMIRTEIMCGKCGGHLGHIFDDGPTETGKRYCVNSISLEFIPENQENKNISAIIDTLTLGGGCFWCIEAAYQQIEGVISVIPGYSGGNLANPSYEQVSTGHSGHTEVVQITYDKKRTSLTDILKVFFTIHDPTTLNQQGADKGSQYRSVIFFRDKDQQRIAQQIIDDLEREKAYPKPIVTALEPFTTFYKAENYHQNYYQNNKDQPYCQLIIQPKLEKLEKVFSKKIKVQQ